jgi:death-on-curing protein
VNEPRWISPRVALAANERLVVLFGGLAAGIRDENLFQAAWARPLNKWHHEDPRPSLFDLAAAYAFAFCKGHVFHDDNKRTSHVLSVTFLRLNGWISPPEPEVVRMMIGVAEGIIKEGALAARPQSEPCPARLEAEAGRRPAPDEKS